MKHLSRRDLIYGGCTVTAASLMLNPVKAGLHFHGNVQSVFVAEGDSISSDSFMQSLSGSPSYAGLYTQSRPSLIYHNPAAAGGTLFHLQTRSPLPEGYKGQGKNVLSVLEGHNDITNNYPIGGSRAGFLSAFATYLDARRSAGMKVILCTMLPSTIVGFNTERNACNTVMSGWVGLHCDALCDFGADATMGPDAAAANTSLYSDGTHPTASGSANLQNIIGPILDGFV